MESENNMQYVIVSIQAVYMGIIWLDIDLIWLGVNFTYLGMATKLYGDIVLLWHAWAL